MPLELRLAAAFVVAAAVAWAATPIAARVATATGFLDRPAGYKGHHAPTPYLGGTALMAGLAVAALAFGGAAGTYTVILGAAGAMWLVGTIDDRLNLSPFLRLALEAAAGAWLWAGGHGWHVMGGDVPDLLLTCFWVIAVVNAFNLMDNMDGAAASVGAISALGIGVLAALNSVPVLAGLGFAIAGACAGFLPHNLARPARVFMGDGGSMPLGLLLACVSLGAASQAAAGANGVATAALLVGLMLLDTALVMFSRKRAGRPLMTGGRDHLTHRLRSRLGSATTAVGVIASGQLLLSALTVTLAAVGPAAVFAFGLVAAVCAAWLIRLLDDPASLDSGGTLEAPLQGVTAPEHA